MGYLLGLCAFALFFLSDWNDWKWKRRELRPCFPLGGVLLSVGTFLEVRRRTPLVSGWLRGLCVLLAAAFLVLLIYTLFFALPAEASYGRPGERRPACTTGVYALCRHPGVLWFAAAYLCLWGGCGFPLWSAVLYTALDVLLVVFEDGWVFPARLSGYEEYRRTTPFLLPTPSSFRVFLARR